MIDAANGGALMDKKPAAARYLISNMAKAREPIDRIDITGETACCWTTPTNHYNQSCGICTSVEHPTDLCPTLQKIESDQPESVGAIGGNQFGKQPYQNWPLDNQTESRVISIAESAISSTTFPTAAVTEIATSRQFSISGGPDEATCSQQFGLANTVSHLQSTGSSNLPLQTIPNPRGNASAFMLRSGKELSKPALQLPRPTEVNSEPDAYSQVQQQEKTVPLPFPTRTLSTRKPESDEELLKIFCKVVINIPLLDTIKQIPKYAKFLKELCVHKRKKMKRSVEVGGIVLALTKNEDFTTGAQALPKKC
ncbi:hypothetical protein CR513_07631, partial [Mucuna pruriens]